MQEYEPETHISDYLRIIRKRKSIIITFFFVTVLIVTAASFLMEPVYRATVTLLIDLESPQVLTTTGSVTLRDTDYYAYKEYFQSQKELIKSRSIVRPVFNDCKINQVKDYLHAKDPFKQFLETIKVEPVRDTRLLLLHVDNKDPKVAADIANRIADLYIARNLSKITQDEVVNLLKNEYLKLQTKSSEYSKIYKHKHPKMIRLKQEVKQIASRLEKAKGRSNISSSFLTDQKANNITIQDRAEAPLVPFKPKKRLNILLSVIVGLFGGVGLAFFFEYLDNTVKEGEEIETSVKWPFLGNVPRINGITTMSEFKKDLFAQINPKHPVSEAYRAIRTSILFSSTEEHPFKSICITSPGPQEGKTTTLCNLGITMAQSRKRVLLVDADMRKSRLHEIFKVKDRVGLSSFLSGQADFTSLVQKTEIDNLFLVSGGPHPPNPSELISSRKMKEFIDRTKAEFDFVLFDTPPMAVVTDAVILAQIVDGTIMVMESGRTNRRILPRINKVLKDGRIRMIGALLNKISRTDSSYHYYAHYYKETK